MIILATILSGLSLLMSILLLIKLKEPTLIMFAILAGIASSLSPYWAIIGAVGAVLGWAYQAPWAVPMGVTGAGMMIWYVWQCTRDHKGFEDAFGAGWKNQISPQQAKRMVKRRWSWFLKLQASPEPIWERDIPFWTVPDTDRQLLCDIWQPGDGDVSGLAFIFFHGGSWVMLDKDFGTRPFFRHLVAQGHTVMDVSYRLCPEVDVYGMMGDVKRATAWMKANASLYGVNPEKIVLGGGPTGGHLALLGGYTPHHPEFTPEDIKGADLSVCGVISYYGPTDLLDGYSRWKVKQRSAKLSPVPIGTKLVPKKAPNYAGRLDMFLGGHPQDAPDTYQLASPITHVHPGCPPTLLIQGDKDILVAVDTTRSFHAKLVESGVPAINLIFPWTDHVFDLLLPQINPAAQSALYDVDRFLALMFKKDK
jgi:acetyl esterase/lipase